LIKDFVILAYVGSEAFLQRKKTMLIISSPVVEAEDWERPDFNSMLERVWEIKQKHKVDKNNLTIYVDAANPEIWSSLKRMFNEPHSEQYAFEKLAYYKENKINPAGPCGMIVIPTPFSTSGAKMLQHTKSLLEDKDNLI
jgi:hypothetical protein